MARTYLPSEVSNVVGLWRNDLKKVNVLVSAFPVLYIFRSSIMEALFWWVKLSDGCVWTR